MIAIYHGGFPCSVVAFLSCPQFRHFILILASNPVPVRCWSYNQNPHQLPDARVFTRFAVSAILRLVEMAYEKFYFNGNDDVEDMSKYRPGGYHPVSLGDVVPKKSTSISRQPRYRIIQKLGHGSFATVWLARDIEEEL